MEHPEVYILLAAYQGEKYIRRQLESVLAQDYPNIRLILSDDGSTDGTIQILEEYAAAHPEKITHYRATGRFGSAQRHFLHLLTEFHDAPYIMFCDQDDVWHKDKVRVTLCKMQQLERGENIPAMVHTDLRVVDEKLMEISPSFWKHSNLDGSRLALNQLLVQNVVTGCTMMINRSLAELVCRSVPDRGILMHDWWIGLLASACGRTGFLPVPTVDYRQHGNNAVGAKNVRSGAYLWHRLTSKNMRRSLMDAAQQAEVFQNSYEDLLTAEQMVLLSAFVEAQKKPFLARNVVYLRHKLIKYGAVRKIAQFLSL